MMRESNVLADCLHSMPFGFPRSTRCHAKSSYRTRNIFLYKKQSVLETQNKTPHCLAILHPADRSSQTAFTSPRVTVTLFLSVFRRSLSGPDHFLFRKTYLCPPPRRPELLSCTLPPYSCLLCHLSFSRSTSSHPSRLA